jgi:hypothetical protein
METEGKGSNRDFYSYAGCVATIIFFVLWLGGTAAILALVYNRYPRPGIGAEGFWVAWFGFFPLAVQAFINWCGVPEKFSERPRGDPNFFLYMKGCFGCMVELAGGLGIIVFLCWLFTWIASWFGCAPDELYDLW